MCSTIPCLHLSACLVICLRISSLMEEFQGCLHNFALHWLRAVTPREDLFNVVCRYILRFMRLLTKINQDCETAHFESPQRPSTVLRLVQSFEDIFPNTSNTRKSLEFQFEVPSVCGPRIYRFRALLTLGRSVGIFRLFNSKGSAFFLY